MFVPIWARSTMDRTSVSGAEDVGSIPAGPTILKKAVSCEGAAFLLLLVRKFFMLWDRILDDAS